HCHAGISDGNGDGRAHHDTHHLGTRRSAVFSHAKRNGLDARWRFIRIARGLPHLTVRETTAGIAALARFQIPYTSGWDGAGTVCPNRIDRTPFLAVDACAW